MQPAEVIDGRMIVAGQRTDGRDGYDLVDPYRNETITHVVVAGANDVDQALAAAARGVEELAALPVHRRAAVLRTAAGLLRERKEHLARTISRQTGKAIRDARREIDRGTYTLSAAAAAIEQLAVLVPPADATPGGEGLTAFAIREPLGIVAAVTPFNAPFNLVLHKLAPAFAAGNATIIKPASAAPLSALQAAEILVEAGMPRTAVSVLPGGAETTRHIVSDPRVDAVTLTGGSAAAAAIAAAAPMKRLLFELGGNGANVVHSDADLDWAAAALVAGGFSNTGQNCNSVQRIIVQRDVLEPMLERLARAAGAMVTGDPLDDATDVGTLVNEREAIRVESWINEAVRDGARLHAGGVRTGAAITPTILSDVRSEMRVACEEIFGPVVVVIPYDTIEEAFGIANSTVYGLQAAVFTRSLDIAFRATRALRSGAVLVNRSTNTRLDHLPFGGVKESGLAREGGRFSVEELTHIKMVVLDATMTGSPHPLARG